VRSPPASGSFRPSRSPCRSPSEAHSLVEITSSDPAVAARAAAILKVHHSYIEKGQRGQSVGLDQERFLEEEERSRHSGFIDVTNSPAGAQSCPSNTPIERHPVSSLADAMPSMGEAPSRSLNVWTKTDWRRLERALVDLKRELRQRGAIDAEAVVELFVEREGVDISRLRGEWSG
jgi:hypothetical protein